MAGESRPLGLAALTAENWEFLLNQTILYATGHVNRWHWRGSLGGVLPDGFDPNALAAEAITEFLQNSSQNGELLHLPITDIQRNLERRVRRHINRLHHRSENRLIRNEPDLFPVTLDDGEAVRIIELFPDPNPRPDQTLIEKGISRRIRRIQTRLFRLPPHRPAAREAFPTLLRRSIEAR